MPSIPCNNIPARSKVTMETIVGVVSYKMEKKWTTEDVNFLIMLYEEMPVLYNTKSKDYFNRDMRTKALTEISQTLDTTGR